MAFLAVALVVIKHLGIILLLFVGVSCSNQDEVIGHQIDVRLYHHFLAVGDGEVYLMEDTNEFPGWNGSAYTFTGRVDTTGRVVFSDVLPGTHYLLGLGHDGIDSVKGYQSFTVDARDPDRRQKIILYVSE